MVQSDLMEGNAGSEEKYLGALISTRNSAKQTGHMLLEKLKSKLTGWCSNMLSHAGRLVLLKSVLMSIPVYYMSIEVLPVGLIRQMESLIAKFFWGKTDKARYLSFVSWGKICQLIEKGGLGLRQLKIFGDALFMKLIWAMMSNEDKIWVQVCRGKYYRHLGFWRARNVNGTSSLWRQVVKMRDFFQQGVKWQVADGEGIEVLSQPWYQGWGVAENARRADRRVTLAEVFDAESNQWKNEELNRLIGEHVAPSILQNVQKPEKRPGMKDMLIWDCTKSGRYIVKDGYECSIMRMGVHGENISWNYIWNWKSVVPKVKLFICRLLSNALPLAHNLNSRIHAISPTCQRCHQENEFATHCFFFCQGSRMVRFAGELGIRTHDLPLDMVLAVQHVVQGMNEDQITTFGYTLWEIWLARNEAILHHKPFQPVAVCKKIAAWKKGEYYTEESLQPFQSIIVPHEYLPDGWQIIADASWDTSQKTGVAYLVYYNGILQWVRMVSQVATDSFQAEAMALQEVMAWVKLLVPQNSIQKIQIFSDCLNLIMAVQEGNTFDIPFWKATSMWQSLFMICRRHMLI